MYNEVTRSRRIVHFSAKFEEKSNPLLSKLSTFSLIFRLRVFLVSKPALLFDASCVHIGNLHTCNHVFQRF